MRCILLSCLYLHRWPTIFPVYIHIGNQFWMCVWSFSHDHNNKQKLQWNRKAGKRVLELPPHPPRNTWLLAQAQRLLRSEIDLSSHTGPQLKGLPRAPRLPLLVPGCHSSSPLEKWHFRNFPGGPVAKPLHSQCRRPGFHSWSRN